MGKAQELTSEQAQDVVKTKRKRNRPDLANFGQEYIEPGDNARYLRHALAAWDLPPIDISDPAQVEQRIKEYFAHCVQDDMKPSIVAWVAGLVLIIPRSIDGGAGITERKRTAQ